MRFVTYEDQGKKQKESPIPEEMADEAQFAGEQLLETLYDYSHEMAIEPESMADRNNLGEVLELLKKQDPTFKAKENEDTGQTLIAGMGELHIEVIKNRLLRDFNLNVKVHKPRVSYRETISKAVEVTGECHRLVNGQQLFAKVKLRMEPDEKIESGVAPSARP